MADELRKANLIDRLLLLLRLRRAFVVEGDSMAPTLSGGDVVLVERCSTVKIGDIVLAQHPYKISVKILKRVAAIGEDGALTLTGDNATASTDSRTFGAVSVESCIGRVVCRLK